MGSCRVFPLAFFLVLGVAFVCTDARRTSPSRAIEPNPDAGEGSANEVNEATVVDHEADVDVDENAHLGVGGDELADDDGGDELADDGLVFEDAAPTQGQVPAAAEEATAQDLATMVAKKKAGEGEGKSCCVMLMLPKYRRPAADGKCTAASLETIEYTDGSDARRRVPISSDTRSINIPYSASRKLEMTDIRWAVEPYGETPTEYTAYRTRRGRRKGSVPGSQETLCQLQQCPVGFHEFRLSGNRFKPDRTSKISPDRSLAYLEGTIRKEQGSRTFITIECYSDSVRIEGSKWVCPAGLSDSWECR